MTKLECARDYINSFPFPEEYKCMGYDDCPRIIYYDGSHTVLSDDELTGEIIAEALTYSVIVKTDSKSNIEDVPAEASRYQGLPHMPPEMSWPEGYSFVAQINCADFHNYDLGEVLPSTGMLYLFSCMDDCTILYYDGPVDSLRLVSPPEDLGPVQRPSIIDFMPAYVFHIDIGGKFTPPTELQKKLDDILGCTLMNLGTSNCTIFGRPVFWQSEDYDDSFECEFSSSIMIFQDYNWDSDVNRHFWVSRKSVTDRSFAFSYLTTSRS